MLLLLLTPVQLVAVCTRKDIVQPANKQKEEEDIPEILTPVGLCVRNKYSTSRNIRVVIDIQEDGH